MGSSFVVYFFTKYCKYFEIKPFFYINHIQDNTGPSAYIAGIQVHK